MQGKQNQLDIVVWSKVCTVEESLWVSSCPLVHGLWNHCPDGTLDYPVSDP